MNHVIIGTAGHIDHGKTTLIRALTGRDTDRLKEERERGISIDLGFTYFELENGRRAGIIDVPGHERFIKNMLAGACGIDILLLVVDAAEGVKPQTLEHADIAGYLNVKEGLIVLTKYEAADEILRELAEDDARDKLRGTFFEDKEIIKVDSVTGYGLAELIKKINELTRNTAPRDINAPARLHVDRAFSIKGFGTVVTGTLSEGTIRVNDALTLCSAQTGVETTVKIKNIQVHETNVNAAFAGQRTALNITGANAKNAARGDVLAAEGAAVRTNIIDASVKIVPRSEYKIKRWDRLRVYLGAREVFARYIELNDGFCQLRFEKDVFVKKGDRFALRRYSPPETIGGGVVLNPAPAKRGRADDETIKDLTARAEGSFADAVERGLRGAGKITDVKTLAALSAANERQTKQALDELINKKLAYEICGDFLHSDILDEYQQILTERLARFHNANPLLAGMPKETLRSASKLPLSAREYDAALKYMDGVKLSENSAALAGFTPRFNERQRRIRDEITDIYLDAGFTPPPKSDVVKDKDTREVFDALAKNALIPLDAETFLHKEHMDAVKSMIKARCDENGRVTLAEVRDMTRSSRKYCLLILEYLDDRRFTKRDGDARVLVQP